MCVCIISSAIKSISDFLLSKIASRFEKPVLELTLYGNKPIVGPQYYFSEEGKIYEVGNGDIPVMWVFKWQYKLQIQNNSSYPAYRVKIIKQSPNQEMKIIFPTEEMIIKANSNRTFDCYITHNKCMTSREREAVESVYPFFLNDSKITITVSYTNEKKREYTTSLLVDKNTTIDPYIPKEEDM